MEDHLSFQKKVLMEEIYYGMKFRCVRVIPERSFVSGINVDETLAVTHHLKIS